jgi:hypothetical protein
LSIGHFLEVGFLAGRQALLEREALVLLGLLRNGSRLGQLIKASECSRACSANCFP